MKIQGDIVISSRGDVLAQKVYGQWDSKDPAVLEFIAKNTQKVSKPKAEKPKEELEMVRARDEDGQFIADDPSTPDVNEAWVVKTVKKVTKKK